MTVGMNASIPNASPSNQVAVWSNVRGILFRCACNFSASAVHQIHCRFICQVAWTPLGLLVEFLAAATTSQFAASLEICRRPNAIFIVEIDKLGCN